MISNVKIDEERVKPSLKVSSNENLFDDSYINEC